MLGTKNIFNYFSIHSRKFICFPFQRYSLERNIFDEKLGWSMCKFYSLTHHLITPFVSVFGLQNVILQINRLTAYTKLNDNNHCFYSALHHVNYYVSLLPRHAFENQDASFVFFYCETSLQQKSSVMYSYKNIFSFRFHLTT